MNIDEVKDFVDLFIGDLEASSCREIHAFRRTRATTVPVVSSGTLGRKTYPATVEVSVTEQLQNLTGPVLSLRLVGQFVQKLCLDSPIF